VAGEHPASSSSTPMWLDDTHNGTSAGAPNSQPAERETGPPSMQLVPVPTPYAVPVHTPVIIPYPVAVPVYIDRPVPVPTYVDRAVPVYVERWARVDRAWPGLEGGDPTPHRAATVPGSMHLPPALLRHILRMGSPGPMRAPRPRGATSTGPYPTEWEMASPEWAMCVEIARRLNDAQRGPQEPAQPHAPPLAIEDAPTAPTTATETATEHMATERQSQRGKRPAEEMDEANSSTADQASQPSQPTQRRRRFTKLGDWPTEWRNEYEEFKAAEGEEERRTIWRAWDPNLKDQVWSSASKLHREDIRRWEKEGEQTEPEEPQPNPAEPNTRTRHSNKKPSNNKNNNNSTRNKNTEDDERGGGGKDVDKEDSDSNDEQTPPSPHEKRERGPRAPREPEERPPAPSPSHGLSTPGNRAPGWRHNHEKVDHGLREARRPPTPPSSSSSSHLTMTNQPIGTPGNDGLSGARDPRPRWPAGSQPNTPRPTWGGTPGVPANPWQGVRRHAVKPDPPAVPDDTNHDPSQGVCRHAARTNRTAWPPAQDAADKNGNHNWMLGTRIGEAKNPGPTHPGRDARTAETQREDPRGRPAQPPKHSRGWEHPNQRVNNNGPPQHPRTGGKGKGRPHGGRGSQQPRDPHTTHPGGRNGKGGGKSHQAKGAGPKGGWQTAQGNDERRLRDRLRTLEHELRDIRGRLDEPRHRPRAVAPEQRGVPDDNPWQPLRRRPRGRRRSIGFEPPSRRPGPPRERERERRAPSRGAGPAKETKEAEERADDAASAADEAAEAETWVPVPQQQLTGAQPETGAEDAEDRDDKAPVKTPRTGGTGPAPGAQRAGATT